MLDWPDDVPLPDSFARRRPPASVDPEKVIQAAERVFARYGVKAKVVRTSPDWRPGDVVTVTYPGTSRVYTYVRGRQDWPGDRVPAKTDAFMDRAFAEGRLTPVLQSGGVAFDRGRL